MRSQSYIATPPGATIREQLKDRGMSQKEFAARMDLSEKHVSKLINGEVQLTPEVAVRLETVLGVPAKFWNNLEAIYREKIIKAESENAMDKDVELSRNLPYAEMAKFFIGQSLYMSTPEPRLDQSQTLTAITAFQEYLDVYPMAVKKQAAQDRLFSLQDKLVKKELYSARLYYNLGTYFGNCSDGGNNYEACIVTAENALKDYPYTKRREDFALLIMKSKYELAQQSVESKKMERFQDAEDEAYGFVNEYPDSK